MNRLHSILIILIGVFKKNGTIDAEDLNYYLKNSV